MLRLKRERVKIKAVPYVKRNHDNVRIFLEISSSSADRHLSIRELHGEEIDPSEIIFSFPSVKRSFPHLSIREQTPFHSQRHPSTHRDRHPSIHRGRHLSIREQASLHSQRQISFHSQRPPSIGIPSCTAGYMVGSYIVFSQICCLLDANFVRYSISCHCSFVPLQLRTKKKSSKKSSDSFIDIRSFGIIIFVPQIFLRYLFLRSSFARYFLSSALIDSPIIKPSCDHS